MKLYCLIVGILMPANPVAQSKAQASPGCKQLPHARLADGTAVGRTLGKMRIFMYSGYFAIRRCFVALLVASSLGAACPQEAQKVPELSPARIHQIAEMLPAAPAGFGAPCSDRNAWGPVAGKYEGSIHAAEGFLRQPIPAWDDDAYLEYSRKGTRPRGEAMLRGRDGQLSALVLAECSEWHGRFLSRIAEQLDVISSQKSWTLPAHDTMLENFNGKRYFIELNSAGLGHNVAETLYLLGDKIPEATRNRAMAALEERMFGPTRRLIAGKDREFWLYASSNWNAVCWNGITSAALTILPDRDQRAYFAAAGELYSNGYLESYTDSGYAEEGIGYWGYGFSNYEGLREQMWLSTGGKIDLYDNEKARRAALFPFQFEMLPGVYADFADAHFMTRPDAGLMARIDHIFNLGLMQKSADVDSFNASLPEAVLAGFPNQSVRKQQDRKSGYAELVGQRTFYADAGVLVDRPDAGGHLGITIKAGGNGGHSHNDIGSYAIGLRSTQPVGDPGGPTAYNASTFSSARFESKLLNSFGHPVPEIDGHLQLEATKVQAPVLSTHFSPEQDQMSIDMSHAYDDPNLKSLVRTLTYSRSEGGSVEIVDSLELSGPVDLEESFPTHGSVRQIDAKTLQFDFEGAHLRVTVKGPAGFVLTQEKVDEYGNPFLRIGAKLHLDSSGKVIMRFSEAE